MDSTSNRIRRRSIFRFSLRTLLTATTLVALALTFIAIPYKVAHDRNQQIAELQRLGASIGYATLRQNNVSKLREWFGMREVDFVANVESDEVLSKLGELKQITWVSIGPGVTDAGLAHLEKLPAIEVLVIENDDITAKGMEFVSRLKTLRRLSFEGRRFDGAVLEPLAGLNHLAELNLVTPLVTDEGLRHLAAMDGLVDLKLNTPLITDDGLRHLAGLTNLRSLSLACPNLTDSGLLHLKALTKLEKIDLQQSATTYAGVAHLLVDLQGRDVVEALVAAGAQVQGATVRFQGSRYSAELIPYLAKIPGLAELSINSGYRGNRPLKGIGSIRSLNMLDLGYRAGFGDALAPLSEVNNLVELRLRCRMEPDLDLSCLNGCDRLEHLILWAVDFTAVDLEDAGQLPALRQLDLHGCRLTEDTLERVSSFTNIEELQLSDTSITPAGLTHLSRLQNLKRLDLTGASIADGALMQVAELQGLESLDLRRTSLVGDVAVHLLNLKRLQELRLSGPSLSDEAVPYLKQMSWLSLLDIGETKISPAGQEELRESLGDAVRFW